MEKVLSRITSLCILASAVALRQDPAPGISIEKDRPSNLRSLAAPTPVAMHEYKLEELVGAPICGESIPVLANATWAYTERDGSAVTYTCDAGFKTTNGSPSFQFSCTKGEPMQITTLPDKCVMVTCPKPVPMPFADMVWQAGVGFGVFGSVVDFMCQKGYSGDGKAHGPKVVKQICNENGNYEFVLNTVTSCELIHCDNPLNMRFANLDSSVDISALVPYNGSLGYACSLGYVVSTNRSMNAYSLSCGDDGEFVPNDPMPNCVPATCPDPPVLEYSATAHVAGAVTIDSRVIYRCQDGYIISSVPASSTYNIRCDFINGAGQYVIPPPEDRCHPVPCLPIPAIPHAHSMDPTTVWKYGMRAPFSCDPGYSLGGVRGSVSFDGSCDTNGEWNINQTPKCSPVVCGTSRDDIPAEMLKYATLTPFKASPIIYQAHTTVQCIPGATVTNSDGEDTQFEIYCGPDGDLISSGVCAIACPPVPRLAHSTSPYFGKVIDYGQTDVIVTCKPGYKTKEGSSTQTVTCDRDGFLSQMDPCVKDDGYLTRKDGESDWSYLDPAHILRDASRSAVSKDSVIVAIMAVVAFAAAR